MSPLALVDGRVNLKKKELDIFLSRVAEDYNLYLGQVGISGVEQPEELVEYLIDSGFISGATVRRVAIISEFERLLPIQNYHKTNTVKSVANLFRISEKTVWSALRYQDRRGE